MSARSAAEPCRTTVRREDHARSSRAQWLMVERGATMRKGPAGPRSWMWLSVATHCAVLPSPISSASSTFRRLCQQSTIQLTPSSWYERSFRSWLGP